MARAAIGANPIAHIWNIVQCQDIRLWLGKRRLDSFYFSMIFPLFIIPITTIIFINSINYIFNAGGKYHTNFFLGMSISTITKIVTLLSFHVSLAYSIILWKTYPKFDAIGNAVIYPANSWFELQHNLNLPFIILSIGILIISLLTTWYSNTNSQLLLSLFLVIEICLVGAFSCINIFAFLLFFEASAIPVFILMIYCGSDRRERLKAAYYFLFFTLYGSISLLLVIINIYILYQVKYVSDLTTIISSYSLWLLIFIAFAVKIPLFPFHLWLPYAHVEANTSTSIILAALMLKLGGYGVLKFMLPLFSENVHLFFRPFALIICIFGIIYGGLTALRQIDLKRQIAFSSISHMSFAVLGIFSFLEIGSKGAMYLMLSHGLTSAALFYLVGVLSERYHTRSVMVYGGLLGLMPLFSFYLIIASLANVGFPGTSGFLPELFVLVAVLSLTPLLILPVLLGMLLTTAGTLILLLRLLFGHTKSIYSASSYSDVTRLEFTVLIYLSFWMIVLGFFDILPETLSLVSN